MERLIFLILIILIFSGCCTINFPKHPYQEYIIDNTRAVLLYNNGNQVKVCLRSKKIQKGILIAEDYDLPYVNRYCNDTIYIRYNISHNCNEKDTILSELIDSLTYGQDKVYFVSEYGYIYHGNGIGKIENVNWTAGEEKYGYLVDSLERIQDTIFFYYEKNIVYKTHQANVSYKNGTFNAYYSDVVKNHGACDSLIMQDFLIFYPIKNVYNSYFIFR